MPDQACVYKMKEYGVNQALAILQHHAGKGAVPLVESSTIVTEVFLTSAAE